MPRLSFKPIADQVIVITGASSGIGLATAQAAAAKGARLVLAARNERALKDICARINREGGHAVAVVADVARREDVETIARAARDEFGGFDTWVNNAGCGMLGRLDETEDKDSRRLFETNFWGIVNGTLVAAEELKSGKGGAIINVGSEVSDVTVPLQGMYCASKHAVKGFTNAFRQEVDDAQLPISVTLIKPAALATPFFEHAKNYTGETFRAPPPVYAPQEAARAILHAATHDSRELYVGGASKLMSALQARLPRAYEWFSRKTMTKAQLSSDPSPVFALNDNLHQPAEDGRVNGRNPGTEKGRTSLYTRASMHPVATVAAVAGVGLALFALVRGGPVRKGLFSAAAMALPALKPKLRTGRDFSRSLGRDINHAGRDLLKSGAKTTRKLRERIEKIAA